jgi:hypothetical protein
MTARVYWDMPCLLRISYRLTRLHIPEDLDLHPYFCPVCQTWSCTLKEKQHLGDFESKVFSTKIKR